MFETLDAIIIDRDLERRMLLKQMLEATGIYRNITRRDQLRFEEPFLGLEHDRLVVFLSYSLEPEEIKIRLDKALAAVSSRKVRMVFGNTTKSIRKEGIFTQEYISGVIEEKLTKAITGALTAEPKEEEKPASEEKAAPKKASVKEAPKKKAVAKAKPAAKKAAPKKAATKAKPAAKKAAPKKKATAKKKK